MSSMNPDDSRGPRFRAEVSPINGRSTLEASDVGWLTEAIEKRVIPELARACERYLPAESAGDRGAPRPLGEDVFESILTAVLNYDSDHAIRIVDKLIEDRVPLQALYLNLFAPAARRIGVLWEEDRLDFLQVTEALAAIQLVLHHLGEQSAAESRRYDETRRIVIARAPGEHHIFGVLTVSEFFRLGGWEVFGGIGQETDGSLMDLVRGRWFALVGISVGSEARISALMEAIPKIRSASKNRRLGILVGGPAFLENPKLFEAVGADAMAQDADQAVARAEGLLEDAFRER
jgi:methanogenic corrinoid protein MtbC1